jgi:hypothetical protein
VLDTDV